MQDVYFLGKTGCRSSCPWSLQVFIHFECLRGRCQLSLTQWVLRWAVHKAGQGVPAPRHVPRTALPNPPKAETWCQQPVPTPDVEPGPQQHPLCFTVHPPFPSQGRTYFTPTQSRHELTDIQRRCTGDYYLTQNKKISSDKRKNLDRLSKLHATAYIPIIISVFKSYFICSPQKGLLATSHQPYPAFPWLEVCFYFGWVEGRSGVILAGMAECRELPCLLIGACCLGREARWALFPPCLFICPPGNKQNCSDTLRHVLSKYLRQRNM